MRCGYCSAVDTELKLELCIRDNMLQTNASGLVAKCNLYFIFSNTRPSLPAPSLITCCFGRLHSAVPQCHNEAACSFPNPILSHPRHSEIYIKPHNKECVQPAWPCYWQTYKGDRDLFQGSAMCLRDCTWSNG